MITFIGRPSAAEDWRNRFCRFYLYFKNHAANFVEVYNICQSL